MVLIVSEELRDRVLAQRFRDSRDFANLGELSSSEAEVYLQQRSHPAEADRSVQRTRVIEGMRLGLGSYSLSTIDPDNLSPMTPSQYQPSLLDEVSEPDWIQEMNQTQAEVRPLVPAVLYEIHEIPQWEDCGSIGDDRCGGHPMSITRESYESWVETWIQGTISGLIADVAFQAERHPLKDGPSTPAERLTVKADASIQTELLQ